MPGLEVDVGPAQGEQLTHAHARASSDDEERGVLVVGSLLRPFGVLGEDGVDNEADQSCSRPGRTPPSEVRTQPAELHPSVRVRGRPCSRCPALPRRPTTRDRESRRDRSPAVHLVVTGLGH